MKIVMKYMVLVIAFLSQVWANAQTDTIQKIIKGRTNSTGQQAKPYVIMISADGFRFDYPELHQARCLLSIQKKGVRADYMMPAYPTLTFPNHYTLVTGMYPSHHGLVDNHFFDPSFQEKYGMSNKKQVMDQRWYGGYPLWVLAEQQKMLSASFYWVGTEAPIQGIQPTYYFNYNEKIPISRRIQTVVDWLQLPAEQRPHF
ncbi:MAG: alkaline phosphatase family protein, partial [Flavisolibacter sp.]